MLYSALVRTIVASMVFCSSGKSDAKRCPDCSRDEPREQYRTSSAELEQLLTGQDLQPLPKVKMTTYWIADERSTSCRGMLYGKRYDGTERRRVLDPAGKELDMVCGRFYAALKMEGTGRLQTRDGSVMVNYSRKHQGKDRFMPVSRHCPYGYGIENKCLMPFYTAAADLSRKTQRQWRAGDVIYIPKIQGVRLPDGKTHNGFLTIADTGSGFHNTGRTRRIDVFVGSSSYRDFWKHHGISRHRPIEIYKVRGTDVMWLRKQALSRLRRVL